TGVSSGGNTVQWHSGPPAAVTSTIPALPGARTHVTTPRRAPPPKPPVPPAQARARTRKPAPTQALETGSIGSNKEEKVILDRRRRERALPLTCMYSANPPHSDLVSDVVSSVATITCACSGLA